MRWWLINKNIKFKIFGFEFYIHIDIRHSKKYEAERVGWALRIKAYEKRMMSYAKA